MGKYKWPSQHVCHLCAGFFALRIMPILPFIAFYCRFDEERDGRRHATSSGGRGRRTRRNTADANEVEAEDEDGDEEDESEPSPRRSGGLGES